MCTNSSYPLCCPEGQALLDIVDRCALTIGGRTLDTIRVMDVEDDLTGVVSEQYLDVGFVDFERRDKHCLSVSPERRHLPEANTVYDRLLMQTIVCFAYRTSNACPYGVERHTPPNPDL